jgi:pilus assembly protein CpaE
MAYRVLIASADVALSSQAAALLEEDREVEVAAVATESAAIEAVLEEGAIDVVLLAEETGPLPVTDLVRDLTARHPEIGFVLALREGGATALRAAVQAGARDVVEVPLTLEALAAALNSAGRWSQAVQRAALGEPEGTEGPPRGVVVAVAGAKGGVGTTTLALHTALAAVRSRGEPSVCLVDFDLQAGDVGMLLDVAHHRSSIDLVDVADALSAPQLESTVYRHPSGMRVLLSPAEGERGEEMTAPAARGILGALKSTYDVVVVDAGTVVTEASAAAIEIAERVMVVVTPDVPALKAANRLGALWGRLTVRRGDARIVINRLTKGTEVQPDLVHRVAELPVAGTRVADAPKAFEAAANAGVPERMADAAVRETFDALARDFAALAPSEDPRAPRRRLSLRAEGGQVAVETAAITGVVMLVALGMWQMVLAGYTYVAAGHAAREGAREYAVGRPVEAAAREDLPRGWRDGMRVKQGENWVEVSLSVPALMPGVDTSARLTTRAGTVKEESKSSSAGREDGP